MISPITEQIRKANENFDKGLEYYYKGQYNRAIRCFLVSKESNVKFNRALKNYKIQYWLFKSFNKINDYSNSMKYLFGFLGLFPAKSLQSFEIGLFSLNKYLDKGDNRFLKQANACFRESIDKYPKDADAWYYCGYSYLLAKNKKNAKECFEMVLVLDNKYKNQLEIEYFDDIKKKEKKN